MKCHGCGHEFPNTSTRCPRCHRSTSRRGRTSTDSRLLEFPRRDRVSAPAEATAPPLPAWRVELNEKVRAIRANRSASASHTEPANEQPVKSVEAGPRAAGIGARQEGVRPFDGTDVSLRPPAARPESSQRPGSPATTNRRSSDTIVEAALTRVRRASENASRAALPKIASARSVQAGTQVSLAVDRQATARALDPSLEIESKVEFAPTPSADALQPRMIKPARVHASVPATRRAKATAIDDSDFTQTLVAGESIERPSVAVFDEIEPLDYLEAEVRKVDRTLGAEFLRNESPPILTHAVIGIVDLVAIAVSCSLFLAFIRIADGSFSASQTKLASGAMVVLISFFYLALTQCLCGRTFGMMLTNSRVVDADSFEPPSASQALLRAAGYFVAAAPAMAGILWAAFDRKHRGLQDYISGTVVVRDF
jgi:uncharacterized RDD family membrane protein YckC